VIKATISRLAFLLIFLALALELSDPSEAIVVAPSDLQIRQALKKGEAAAKEKIPPNFLYFQFGPSKELKPHGFLMTKMNGLTVMSTHFALRSEKPSRTDVEQLLNSSELQVVVIVFGSSTQFAVDSYLVLKQSDRIIKPQRVRLDARASRSPAWPESPAFRAKIVATFPYDGFDPEAWTTIVVFPGEGGEVSFDLDFSAIP
jgi:hypothetical protein